MNLTTASGAGALACPLCAGGAGLPIWADDDWRLLRVEDAAFPAYYQLVFRHHVAEFSDLSAMQRRHCVELIAAIERLSIAALRPTKMNVASLGNVVPHLHWHLIARFTQDSHFPQPIWGVGQRVADPAWLVTLRLALPALDTRLAAALSAPDAPWRLEAHPVATPA